MGYLFWDTRQDGLAWLTAFSCRRGRSAVRWVSEVERPGALDHDGLLERPSVCSSGRMRVMGLEPRPGDRVLILAGSLAMRGAEVAGR